MEKKICTKCNNELDIKYFELRTDTNKYRNYCKKCNKGYLSSREDKIDKIKDLFLLGKKECSRCNNIKDLEHFSKDKSTYTGYCSNCKDCVNIRTSLNKDSNRNRSLKLRYGIDLEYYTEMYKSQEGKCKICNNHYNLLFVDHNHSTREVRALLCNKCNSGIAYLKEDINIINNAINYIKEYNGRK